MSECEIRMPHKAQGIIHDRQDRHTRRTADDDDNDDDGCNIVQGCLYVVLYIYITFSSRLYKLIYAATAIMHYNIDMQFAYTTAVGFISCENNLSYRFVCSYFIAKWHGWSCTLYNIICCSAHSIILYCIHYYTNAPVETV